MNPRIKNNGISVQSDGFRRGEKSVFSAQVTYKKE